MIHGAINAYKAFSGGQGSGGGGGGGGGGGSFLDTIGRNLFFLWEEPRCHWWEIGSTYKNAQQVHALYKQFDKNGDGKITADDVEILLKEMGLGAVSPCSYTADEDCRDRVCCSRYGQGDLPRGRSESQWNVRFHRSDGLDGYAQEALRGIRWSPTELTGVDFFP